MSRRRNGYFFSSINWSDKWPRQCLLRGTNWINIIHIKFAIPSLSSTEKRTGTAWRTLRIVNFQLPPCKGYSVSKGFTKGVSMFFLSEIYRILELTPKNNGNHLTATQTWTTKRRLLKSRKRGASVFQYHYYYYYYYYYYLMQLSFHSVAVVLTLIQAKRRRINIHKRNNTKTQYKQYKTL